MVQVECGPLEGGLTQQTPPTTIMNYYLRFPFLLCTALALSMAAPGAMGADRKRSDRDKKKQSHRVEKRDRSSSSRNVSSARRSSSSSRHVASARHSSDRGRDKHKAVRTRHDDRPKSRDFAASSSNRSTRLHPVTQSGATARRAASRSDDHRSRVSNSSPRVARSDRDRDRRHSSSVARHSSSSHQHRDRSRYVRRHENHDHDWYRRNGWTYDRDYYTNYHTHRYYNDSYGWYTIVNSAPPAYYVDPYTPAPALQYRDFSSDYGIRLDVQEALADAGYYNGPLDGDIGPGTRNAIARYQYDRGLPVTGRIDETLLDALGLL